MFQFIKLVSSFNTFHTKLSKPKKRGKEGILLRNKWKQGSVFFSKLWLAIFLPVMAHLIWETIAQVPTASDIECLECLVDLLYLWTLFATKQWLFGVKMYIYLWEKKLCMKKNFMHLSRYEKNTACYHICHNFWKLCTIMCFSFWRAQSQIIRVGFRA